MNKNNVECPTITYKRIAMEDNKTVISKYGDFSKIVKLATSIDNIYDYNNKLMNVLRNSNNTIGITSFNDAKVLANAVTDVYEWENATHFICDVSGDIDGKWGVNYDDEVINYPDVFDKITDSVICFKDKAGKYDCDVLRVTKSNATFTYGKYVDQPCIILSWLCIDGDNVVSREKFMILRDVPKKIFIHTSTRDECLNSHLCNCRCVKMLYKEDEIAWEGDFCLINKYVLQNDACTFVDLINPHILIDIMYHVWNMYLNRKTLNRKNSRLRKSYESHKVSTIVKSVTNDSYKILPVHDYYQYERKEWQGGHHKSPIAHDRREHMRYYRNPDGSIRKAVKVSSSRVNHNNTIENDTVIVHEIK